MTLFLLPFGIYETHVTRVRCQRLFRVPLGVHLTLFLSGIMAATHGRARMSIASLGVTLGFGG